ncbi:Uncharacterised protein [Citrobacter koseri]|nr:Uncharacterised protein [Citrobacter koseri]
MKQITGVYTAPRPHWLAMDFRFVRYSLISPMQSS